MGPAVVAGLAMVLMGLFGSAYWDGYQVRREAAQLVRERDELRRHNAQLREEIRLLHTPEYIERLAREQLGLVRPGEIAVILVQPTPAPATPPAVKAAGGDGWWARLRRRWSP
jgi:cell division protein FtsL